MERHHDIARYILDSIDSLLRSRKLMGKNRFSDTDETWGLNGKVGSMASMQGLRAVFGAVAALGTDYPALLTMIEPYKLSLLDEWQTVLEGLESSKYLVLEYDPTQGLTKMLEGESRFFLDAVSWALSTSILIHYVVRNWPDFVKSDLSQTILSSNRREIVQALKILIESQCRDGGWNFMNGIENGHLYFTWSVTQGFSDVGDYILGESENELGITPDVDLAGFIEKELPGFRQRFMESKERAIKFLTENYLNKACTTGLAKDDLSDQYIQVEFAKETSETALVISYCEAYLLECLILLGYDIGSRERQINLDRLYVRILDKMPALSSPVFADDPELSTLHFKLTKQLGGRQGTATFHVLDGGLWPQLLRAMILYKFYTRKEKELDERLIGMVSDSPLTLLMKSRRDLGNKVGDGLWDTAAFNLAITSRTIEGLIDCYDYYSMIGSIVQTEVSAVESSDLTKILAEAIFPHIEKKLAGVRAEQSEKLQEIADDDRNLVTDENLNAKVIALLRAAVDPIEHDRVLKTDEFLHILLGGPLPAQQLYKENDDAYNLLKSLVTISFLVSALLFDHIISEAILCTQTKKELVDEFRRKDDDTSQETLRLHERIKTVLMELSKAEIDAMKNPKKTRPNYLSLIQPIIGSPSGLPGRKG
jgi:hypothetical protein